jgi:hypothetical protein
LWLGEGAVVSIFKWIS